jgi:serine/threonine-protein kinase
MGTTMNQNPYDAPKANVETPAEALRVPAEVLTKIRNAWVAGCISGCITLIITLLAISGTSVLGFDAWELIDVALIFGLAFGIYRKSRVCAVSMLVYFVAAKILIIKETGQASGAILALIFIYYYWQGIVGTFQYHKFVERMRPATSSKLP